jgi:hypothetical protein
VEGSATACFSNFEERVMGVGDWFLTFCSKLKIGPEKRGLIAQRASSIVGRLNRDFRSLDSKTEYRFYVGSYGRKTAIPSISDIDLLYELPANLYAVYDSYSNNGQSALLSKVRTSLHTTYPTSDIAGDGQVVVINFDDGIKFEVLPAFLNTDLGYTFADSNGGGSWRTCKPKQEMNAFLTRDSNCNHNLVALAQMVRAWRDNNNVPMSGMLIDTLTYQFIENWPHKDQSYFYYDWITRDFFNFLVGLDSNQEYWLAPGSCSRVYRQGQFNYEARQAELAALEAIEHQKSNHDWSAKHKYREIYGTNFPS